MNTFSGSQTDISKTVSVSADGPLSMTGREAGFIYNIVHKTGQSHFIVLFHCIAHQEALCVLNVV